VIRCGVSRFGLDMMIGYLVALRMLEISAMDHMQGL
jgi:hypothetical protein